MKSNGSFWLKPTQRKVKDSLWTNSSDYKLSLFPSLSSW